MKLLVLIVSFITLNIAQAAKIAIIDSGVDYKHEMLISQMWVNPLEIADNNRDEDHNGYQDDVYGWNFAEQNNQIIDYKYVGTFSDDPYKYFDIQGKMFWGRATKEELEWLKSK
ncbi:MAG: hypothetical protein ACOCUT_04080, partial [bacterium]